MPSITDEIQGFLPLRISDVDADGDGISIEGDRWRLRINTKWRVNGGGGGLEGLVGDDVVETFLQYGPVGFDLGFTTREGRTLQIRSDFPYGEWIISVWSPGDERRVPVFRPRRAAQAGSELSVPSSRPSPPPGLTPHPAAPYS